MKPTRQDPPPYPIARRENEPLQRWSWEDARRELEGLPGGRGLNIAFECVDRHVAHGRGDKTAFVFISTGERREVSYAELAALTDRVAAAFRRLGVEPGDRVFSLMGRKPQLYFTALGALKAGAVFCPLFSSFGPEPVRARLALGEARVLVTTDTLYRWKVREIRDSLPSLEHVVVVSGASTTDTPVPDSAGAIDFQTLVEDEPSSFEIGETDPQSPALLHFTSGTTGTPKGALHVHEAVIAHSASARTALDLRAGDTYWCTADPGWVTGISYGLIAPLVVGATAVVDEAEFEAERWRRTLEEERVNVWYTAPTAIRMLRRAGLDDSTSNSLPHLRHLASVGEPLEAESVLWGARAFGGPFHDTWWQTETGAIMLANLPGADVRPGSMGRPLPGVEAAVVRRHDGGLETVTKPEEVGELAIRAGWPSMFRAYVGDRERYRASFVNGWYLSGDLVRRDADGYFWFVGRADDAIQSAGHLIGPFEVEGVMRDHPAVADAAAYGRPDPVAFEIVCAAVVLRDPGAGDDALRLELLGHARRRLGPAVAPREIEFLRELPKTPSGKTIRRALRPVTE